MKTYQLLHKAVLLFAKHSTFFICCILFLTRPVKLNAQFYFYNEKYYETDILYEAGTSIGGMNCFTDLGGQKGIGKKYIKDINVANSQFCGGLFCNIIYKNAIALRVEASFGCIKAYDSILKNVKETTFGRYERNLSFKSAIKEISAIAEVHPLYVFNSYHLINKLNHFSPYLLVGIGYYWFNPKAKILDKWVALQTLKTEGQGFAEYPDRKVYSLHQVNVPLGVGIKYEVSPLINLRLEGVYRILFTDYLDDVSTQYIDPSLYPKYLSGENLANAIFLNNRNKNINQLYMSKPNEPRGNCNNNDAYFSINIKFSFILGREKR